MPASHKPLKQTLYDIIFEADTPAGKAFDVALLGFILLSVLIFCLDTVPSLYALYSDLFIWLEWVITLLFTVEYGLRLYCAPSAFRYATSFFGLVDLLSILPTYLGLLIPGVQTLAVLRGLRLLRVFRILKLVRFLDEATVLTSALKASLRKIIVFLMAVTCLVIPLGTLMYLIEGPEHGFTSIPESIYWAIVTLTTVGYGDISPETPLGKGVACVIMILGYGIIAVPTGIVSAELTEAKQSGQ